MKDFNISTLPLSTVLYLHSDRGSYQLDPAYQRESDIWPLEKRQLLIDSIINGFDIPKIYFHRFPRPRTIRSTKYTHAIVDGKQRLASIWGFIDGDYSLSDTTEYLPNRKLRIAGLSYAELGQQFPHIKTKFDSFPLSIVTIETEDVDLIEDMFSRLNEAVPLSAAEKRNAFGGPIPGIIRRLSKTRFFTNNLPFGNKRYRHYDLIAKFLVTEYNGKVVDTKKVYLDEFVREWRRKRATTADKLRVKTARILDRMSKLFKQKDPLLRSVGMIVLYYHLFRIADEYGFLRTITRKKLLHFEEHRAENRRIAEDEFQNARYDLLEFDRFVQTPNDAYAIAVRLKILLDFEFGEQLPNNYSI